MATEVKARFEKIRKLGKGSFGIVNQYRNKLTGKMVAIKQITAMENFVAFQRECNIHGKVNHLCILTCHEILKDRKSIFFVLELADRGSLANLMFTREGNQLIPEPKAKEIIVQILCALCYLHARKILHRDIKPENVLLFANGRAKLCDFGFARDIAPVWESKSLRMSIKGSPLYMSPEMAIGRLGVTNKSTYDWRSDVWSLGMMLHEMCYGVVPHKIACSKSISEAMRRIKNATILDLGDGDLAVLLRDILQPNSHERLTWLEIIQHPWTQSVTRWAVGEDKQEFVTMLKHILRNAENDSLQVARVWQSRTPKKRHVPKKNLKVSRIRSQWQSPSWQKKEFIIPEKEELDEFVKTEIVNHSEKVLDISRKKSLATVQEKNIVTTIPVRKDTFSNIPESTAQNVSQKQSQSAVQAEEIAVPPPSLKRSPFSICNKSRKSVSKLSQRLKFYVEPKVMETEVLIPTLTPILERIEPVQMKSRYHVQPIGVVDSKKITQQYTPLLPVSSKAKAKASNNISSLLERKKVKHSRHQKKPKKGHTSTQKAIAESTTPPNSKHSSASLATRFRESQFQTPCLGNSVKSRRSLWKSNKKTQQGNVVQKIEKNLVSKEAKEQSLPEAAGHYPVPSPKIGSNPYCVDPIPLDTFSKHTLASRTTNQQEQAISLVTLKPSNLPSSKSVRESRAVRFQEIDASAAQEIPTKPPEVQKKISADGVLKPRCNQHDRRLQKGFKRQRQNTPLLKSSATTIEDTKSNIGLKSSRSYSKLSQDLGASAEREEVQNICQLPTTQPNQKLDPSNEPSPPMSSRKLKRKLRIPPYLDEWIEAIFDLMHEVVSDTYLEELYQCFSWSLIKKDPKLYDDLLVKDNPGGGKIAFNEERDFALWMGVPLVLFKYRRSPELVIHWDCKSPVSITEGAVLLAVALVHGIGCEGRSRSLRKYNTWLKNFANMTINLLESHFDNNELTAPPGPREQIWGSYLLGKLIVIFNITSLKNPFWRKLAKGLVAVISCRGKRDFFGAYVPLKYRDRILYGCVFIVNEILHSQYRAVSNVIAAELKLEDTSRILLCMDTSHILHSALEIRTTSQIFRLVVYLFVKKQYLDKANVEEEFVEAKGIFHAKRMYRKLRDTNDPTCLEAIQRLTNSLAIIALRNTMFYSVFESHRILEDWVFPLLERCVNDSTVAEHSLCYYGCQMLGSMMRTDFFLQKVIQSNTIDQLISILTTNKKVQNVRASCIALGNIALLVKEQLFTRAVPVILKKLQSGFPPKLHKDATILFANILRIHVGQRGQVILNSKELLLSLLKNEALPILEGNLSRYWNERFTARDHQTFQRVLEHTMESLNRSILLGLNCGTISFKFKSILYRQAKACRPILQKIAKIEKQESKMGMTASFLLEKIFDITS